MATWIAGKLTKPAFKQAFGYLQDSYPDSQLTTHLAQLATTDNPLAPSEDAPFAHVGNALPSSPPSGPQSMQQRALGHAQTKAKSYALNKAVGIVWSQAVLPLTVVLWLVKLILGFVEERRAAAARNFKGAATHKGEVERVVAQIKAKPEGKLLASKKEAVDGHMMRSADVKKTVGPASALSAGGASTQPLHFVDLGRLNSVISVDTESDTCVVQAGCTFRDLLRATTASHLQPQVVPPFLDVTVGGAFAGSATGSTSWRKGTFVEGVIEVEVALASGEVIKITREGAHAALFHALHSSFHSIATILSLKLQLVHAPRYLWQRYENFKSVSKASARLQALLDAQEATAIEHVEMIAFSPTNVTLIVNQGVEAIDPAKHKVVTFGNWWETQYASYVLQWSTRYQSNRTPLPVKHCIPLMDFFTRFENGSFWQSDFVFSQLPWPLKGNSFASRLLVGWALDSDNIRRTIESSEDHLAFERTRVVQDALIPLHHLTPFVQWQLDSMKIAPLYLCPVLGSPTDILAPNFVHPGRASNSAHGHMYVSVGIYGQHSPAADSASLNTELVQQVYEAGGRTMLYAHNFHSPDLWSKMFDRKSYDAVRKQYGAVNAYPHVYDKVALRESDRAVLAKPSDAAEERRIMRAVATQIVLNKLKFWQQ